MSFTYSEEGDATNKINLEEDFDITKMMSYQAELIPPRKKKTDYNKLVESINSTLEGITNDDKSNQFSEILQKQLDIISISRIPTEASKSEGPN